MDPIKKHAYLIIAHGNAYVLEKLIQLLDDERNDIYIHVDKKTKHFDFDRFNQLPQKSRLQFTNRTSVYWGHISLVKAELILFGAASKHEYSYYHLISGSDLPLKSQDEIHRFFELNNGKEFIGFSNDRFDIDRVDKIHLFPRYQRAEANEPFKRLLRKIRLSFLSLQEKVSHKRGSEFVKEFKFGSQWVSLTNQFVKALLKEGKNILKFYKYSNCPDEVYKQTFAINSTFKKNIYDLSDELNSCQRFMDWKRGRPYTFREEDFDLIMSSEMLFARKFDENVDTKIVDKIFKHLTEDARID